MHAHRLGKVGTLPDGGRCVVFERKLAQPVIQVWTAITEPEHLARWAPGVHFEQRLGGRYELWFGDGCDGSSHESGDVAVYQPPTQLQLGTMRFELTSEGRGCLLKFSDVLKFVGDRSEAEITHAVLAGWHRFLDLLEDALMGVEIDFAKPEPDYANIEVETIHAT